MSKVLSKIISEIEASLADKVVTYRPVPGGDINEAYAIEFKRRESVFLKFNSSQNHSGIIQSEIAGLEKLSAYVSTPEVICSEISANYSYLVLDLIYQSGHKDEELFASELVQLHQETASQYGCLDDNYIGLIPQVNDNRDDYISFYVECRIEPQAVLAKKQGYLKGIKTAPFYKFVEQLIPREQPSLVHGDLWAGNLIYGETGQPYFIDPAVAYSHREFDIAMMKLFGGFSDKVFNVYNEIFPLEDFWEQRLPVYQLYYLLVHLNLFGQSYEAKVKEIFELD